MAATKNAKQTQPEALLSNCLILTLTNTAPYCTTHDPLKFAFNCSSNDNIAAF